MSGAMVPRIGVVSDSPLQLFEIQSALRDAAYEIVLACAPARIDKQLLNQTVADAWVVSLSQDSESADLVALLADQIEVPVLLDENVAEGSDAVMQGDWSLRLIDKLRHLTAEAAPALAREAYSHNPLLAEANVRSSQSRVARNVWVLGASLGGPEAVTEFLRALPPGLPLSFVYAQHIDNNFSTLLAEVMARNTRLNAVLLTHDSALSHGQLGIVPVETEVRFRALGKIEGTNRDWPGPYAPLIDQVIDDVAAVYAECSGAIIFSGMGDDGARGCEAMHLQGGTVWAQEPSTCICSAMPEAAIDTGQVEFIAGPAQLAHALAQRYSTHSHIQE